MLIKRTFVKKASLGISYVKLADHPNFHFYEYNHGFEMFNALDEDVPQGRCVRVKVLTPDELKGVKGENRGTIVRICSGIVRVRKVVEIAEANGVGEDKVLSDIYRFCLDANPGLSNEEGNCKSIW